MATSDLINYYANLLIQQYLQKPKAYATVQTLVTGPVMDQLPTQVLNGFNLNTLNGGSTAVGVQLDMIGKYAGVVRTGNSLAGAPITLSDADYLLLINFAIASNSNGSALSQIQLILSSLFTAGQIYVFDYSNMHMSYLLSSSVGSQNLANLLITEGLLPKPMGVQLATVIYAPIINQFFGFRDYYKANTLANPFNNYSVYTLTWPWLTYQNAVVALNDLLDESGNILTQESSTSDLIYLG